MPDLDATLSRLARHSMLELPEDTSELEGELEELFAHLEELAGLDAEGIEPFAHVSPMQHPDDSPLEAAPLEVAQIAANHVWRDEQVFVTVPPMRSEEGS